MSSLRSTPMISAPSAADSGLKANVGGRSFASARARSIPIAPSMPRRFCAVRFVDYGPQRGRRSRLLRIDQDEGDAARLGAAIDPGVIGALLHQYVARLEMNFRFVEQHVDLAGHDDGIIHRASAVHGGMARWQSARSEEHTSELQSRENLVCRLLLEKKKK